MGANDTEHSKSLHETDKEFTAPIQTNESINKATEEHLHQAHETYRINRTTGTEELCSKRFCFANSISVLVLNCVSVS